MIENDKKIDYKDGKCGVSFKTGDTVKLRVDIGRSSIAFGVNNNKLNDVSQIAVSSKPHYMAVCIGRTYDSIILSKCTFIGAQKRVEMKESDAQVLWL